MSSSKLYASYFLLSSTSHLSYPTPGNGQGYHRRGGTGGWYSCKNCRKYSLRHARTRLILSRSRPTVLRVSLSDTPSPLSVKKAMTSRVPMLLPPRPQSPNPSPQELKRRHRNLRSSLRKHPNPPPPLPRSSFQLGTSSSPLPLLRRLPSNVVFLLPRSRAPVPTEGLSVRTLRSSSLLRIVSACPLPSQRLLLPNTPTFL